MLDVQPIPAFRRYLKGRVGVLSVYLDESGHDKRLLVVGGLVSTPDRWMQFSGECEEIRAYFKIRYVHTAELLNLKKKRLYGHLSFEQRKQVLECFFGAIYRHTEFSICSNIIPLEYERLTTPEWRSINGTAYSTCVGGILLGLWEELIDPEQQNEETVSVFLEDGHAHTGEALETVRGYKRSVQPLDIPVLGTAPPRIGLQIGMVGTGTKDDSPPLWGADFIAHCIYNQIIRRDAFCEELMDLLEDKVPSCGVNWDEEKIKYLVNASREAGSTRALWDTDTHHLVRHLHQFGIVAQRHPRGVVLDASGMTPEQEREFLGDEEDK